MDPFLKGHGDSRWFGLVVLGWFSSPSPSPKGAWLGGFCLGMAPERSDHAGEGRDLPRCRWQASMGPGVSGADSFCEQRERPPPVSWWRPSGAAFWRAASILRVSTSTWANPPALDAILLREEWANELDRLLAGAHVRI